MSIPEYAIQQLFVGASQGNLNEVKKGLLHVPLNHRHPGNGATALIIAAANYRDNVLQHLIERGAQLNLQTSDSGATALIVAVANNNENAVKILVNNEANLDHKDKHGKTALMHTIHWMRTGNGYTMFKKLIAAGANVNLKDNAGRTVSDYIQADHSLTAPQKAKLMEKINEAEAKQAGDPTTLEGGGRKSRRRHRRTRRHR